MQFRDKWILTTTRTSKTISNIWIIFKLSTIEIGDGILFETWQTNMMITIESNRQISSKKKKTKTHSYQICYYIISNYFSYKQIQHSSGFCSMIKDEQTSVTVLISLAIAHMESTRKYLFLSFFAVQIQHWFDWLVTFTITNTIRKTTPLSILQTWKKGLFISYAIRSLKCRISTHCWIRRYVILIRSKHVIMIEERNFFVALAEIRTNKMLDWFIRRKKMYFRGKIFFFDENRSKIIRHHLKSNIFSNNCSI